MYYTDHTLKKTSYVAKIKWISVFDISLFSIIFCLFVFSSTNSITGV